MIKYPYPARHFLPKNIPIKASRQTKIKVKSTELIKVTSKPVSLLSNPHLKNQQFPVFPDTSNPKQESGKTFRKLYLFAPLPLIPLVGNAFMDQTLDTIIEEDETEELLNDGGSNVTTNDEGIEDDNTPQTFVAEGAELDDSAFVDAGEEKNAAELDLSKHELTASNDLETKGEGGEISNALTEKESMDVAIGKLQMENDTSEKELSVDKLEELPQASDDCLNFEKKEEKTVVEEEKEVLEQNLDAAASSEMDSTSADALEENQNTRQLTTSNTEIHQGEEVSDIVTVKESLNDAMRKLQMENDTLKNELSRVKLEKDQSDEIGNALLNVVKVLRTRVGKEDISVPLVKEINQTDVFTQTEINGKVYSVLEDDSLRKEFADSESLNNEATSEPLQEDIWYDSESKEETPETSPTNSYVPFKKSVIRQIVSTISHCLMFLFGLLTLIALHIFLYGALIPPSFNLVVHHDQLPPQ